MWAQLSQRLLQLLADKKHKLQEEDIAFLAAFGLQERSNREPVPPQTVHDSQLVRSVALLLKRLLEQHRLRAAGWQRAAYCRMVHTAALAMAIICRRAACQLAVAAHISISQQLAASGVWQQLPATLVKLADLMQNTTATEPRAKAACTILTAATLIISLWPGSAGALGSLDAGPLALPAIQLASILEQHMITQSNPRRLHLGMTIQALVIALAEQLSPHKQQQHTHGHQLVSSPDFLRLLLTLIAIDLKPYPSPAVPENAGVTAAAAVMAAAAGPELTAVPPADRLGLLDQGQRSSSTGSCTTTAPSTEIATSDSISSRPEAAADTPCLPDQGQGGSSIGSCIITASCTEVTTSGSDGSTSAPAAAATPCLPDQSHSSSSSTGSCTTATPCTEVAESAIASDSIGSSTLEPSAVASNYLNQHTSSVSQKQLQLLQHLHPALQLSSSGGFLTTLLEVLIDRESRPSSMCQLIGFIQSAGQCVEVMVKALHGIGGESTNSSSSSSSRRRRADNTKSCLPGGSITAALCVLPPLLLDVWSWTAFKDTAAAAAPHFYAAVSKLVCNVMRCWEVQLWLHAAGLPHGVGGDQLPIAELQDLLLQHLEAAVQQQSSSQAAVREVGSTPAAAAGSEAPAGAASKHSFIELLTMLGELQPVTSSTAGKQAAAVTGMLEQCFRMSSSSNTTCCVDSGCSNRDPSSAVASSHSSSNSTDCSSSSSPITSSSSSSFGSSCFDLINDPRLPSLCSGLISMLRRHLPQPGSTPDAESSFNYHSDPGVLLLAAQSALPGSQERQQLFSLLISISKRARALPEQVQVTRGGPEQLTALNGCDLYGVAHKAAHQMLQHLTTPGSNTGSSNSSSGTLLPGSSAAGLSAAAPWLVLLSRNLIHLAGQLDDIFGYDPTCDSWEWYLNNVLRYYQERYGSQLLRLSLCVNGWAWCVDGTVGGLLQARFCHNDCAASHSRCLVSGASTTQHAAAAAGAAAARAETLPQVAAAGTSSSATAVLQRQLSQLLLVQQQLEAKVLPKLKELEELCLMVYNIYLKDPHNRGDRESLQRLTGNLKKLAADPRPGLAAAATAMLAVEDSAGDFMRVLQQWGIQQLQQQLLDLGSQACAALPLSGCCNNPGCSNMRGDSESVLVSGKGCVCAGCEVARYCGRECQAAHWQQHKVICKIIKRQRMGVTAV